MILRLVILFALLASNAAQAQALVYFSRKPATSPYLIDEGFEETGSGGAAGSATDGFDSPLVTTITSGVSADYVTSPAPLVGSQSCLFDPSGGSCNALWTLTSSLTNCEAYFRFSDSTLPIDASQPIFEFLSSSSAVQADVYLMTTGKLRIGNGGTTAQTVSTLSASTTYHFWMTYNTNGNCTIAFATDVNRPSGGVTFTNIVAAPSNAPIAKVRIRSVSGSGQLMIVDAFKVSASTIPSNP